MVGKVILYFGVVGHLTLDEYLLSLMLSPSYRDFFFISALPPAQNTRALQLCRNAPA